MSKSLTKITSFSAALVVLGSSSAFASDYSNKAASDYALDAQSKFVFEVTSNLGQQAFEAITKSSTLYLVDITSSLGDQALDKIEKSKVADDEVEIALNK